MRPKVVSAVDCHLTTALYLCLAPCSFSICLPGYFYRPSTGQLVVSAANRINVKGWNSGMTANTATNRILGQ